jgi:hypothetical protein
MKLKLPQQSTRWKTSLGVAVLFTLLLAALSGRSNPVVDTVTKLSPSDISSNLFFGTSVAIDAGNVAVGARDNGRGAVYTYAFINGSWQRTQARLVDPAPPGSSDAFGTSVSIEDGLLVVGQPKGSGNLSGQAIIFRLVSGRWVLERILSETNPPAPVNGFGTSVSLEDNFIAVGNPQDPTGPGSGAVSIFVANGTNWTRQAKITAPAGTAQAFFGVSVSIYNDTVLVGANQVGITGAAYVFVRNGTNWTLQATLKPTGLPTGANFGTSVALDDDTAVVGAPGQPTNGVNGGAVYIFQRVSGNWILRQELTSSNNTSGLGFGTAVAVRDNAVTVGVPFRGINGTTNAGVADIYLFNGTSWVFAQEVSKPTPKNGALFGNSVGLGPSGLIVGAPSDSSIVFKGGSAYIFQSSQNNFPAVVSATASPNVLSPPNRQMVPVTISVDTQGTVASTKIVKVSSDDGHETNPNDWNITGDLTVDLRAKANGNKDRVYTVTVQTKDAFGNSATTDVHVTAAH